MQSQSTDERLNKVLKDLLSKNQCEPLSGADSSRFLEIVRHHWIGPLIYDRIYRSEECGFWPAEIMAELSGEAQSWALKSSLRRIELRRAPESLENGNVDSLVLKGAALAQTHYSQAYLRTSCDTDILVSSSPPTAVYLTRKAKRNS